MGTVSIAEDGVHTAIRLPLARGLSPSHREPSLSVAAGQRLRLVPLCASWLISSASGDAWTEIPTRYEPATI